MSPINTINYITSCSTFAPSRVLIVVSLMLIVFVISFIFEACIIYAHSGSGLGFILPVLAIGFSIFVIWNITSNNINISGSPFNSISPSLDYSANVRVEENTVSYYLKGISYESAINAIQTSKILNVVTVDGEVIELQTDLIRLSPNAECYVEIVNKEYVMPDSKMEKFKLGYQALSKYMKCFSVPEAMEEAYGKMEGLSPQLYLDSLTTCKSITLYLPFQDDISSGGEES